MSLRVAVLDSAEQDLKVLRAYILKNFSADTWRTTYANIKAAIHNLQNIPQAGCIPEEQKKNLKPITG